MQISKVWLIGVVTYVLGIFAQKYGMKFHDETADAIANIILVLIPLVIAWLNKSKPAEDDTIIFTPKGAKTDAQYPSTFESNQ